MKAIHNQEKVGANFFLFYRKYYNLQFDVDLKWAVLNHVSIVNDLIF